MAQNEQLEATLARIALGDRQAFHALYRRTSAKLFGICLRLLGDRGEAEEVLQETYLKVWNNAGRYAQAKASPITWMTTIARNQSIDRLRSRKPAADLDKATDIPDGAPSPEAVAIDAGDKGRLNDCLAELDPPQASTIRAAFFGEITYEGLARRDGIPLGTVKSRIRRSLMKLRDCLER